jgi:hypothetical protein
MSNILKIESTMVSAAPLADGSYPGVYSGYHFTTQVDGHEYHIELNQGIRGTSPATLTIANGIPSIKMGR